MAQKFSVLLVLISITGAILAGNPTFVNGDNVFGTRAFIENKGQFDHINGEGDKIFFLYEHGREKIYFTSTGVVYELAKYYPLTEKEYESLGDNDHAKVRPPKIYHVRMSWEGCNKNLVPQGEERQGYYFTYGGPEYNSYAYKKIIYKNVYDGIDIEYLIPHNRQVGIKYNVLVRPGANPGQLKLLYSGDVKKLKKGRDGNVEIVTPLEDIVEHAPESFDESQSRVACGYAVENNVISFNLPQGYDRSKNLVIDPWVTITTVSTTVHYGLDVDYDNNGNLFVYGDPTGAPPSCAKLSKYNSSGALVWTFSGVISTSTPTWGIGGNVSNFVAMKTNGKTYLGQGFDFNGATVVRLDPAGNYDNFMTSPIGTFREIWDMAYHCSTGRIYGIGGSTNSTFSGGVVNQVNANYTPVAFIMTGATAAHDIVNHTIDDNGEFYQVYASSSDPAINNKIVKVNSVYTTSVWIAPTTFSNLVEAQNKTAYPGLGALFSNGYNCLAVNGNFLFYYDGLKLAAYNKANGNIVAQTTVPGHSLKSSGGIAVDNCNNIYIGGHNFIKCYNFNGTTFSTLTAIPLATPGFSNVNHVTDLKLDKANNILYMCGSHLVGTYNAVHSTTCMVPSQACVNPFPLDYAICAGSSATIEPVNYFNLINPTYSLFPGGATNTTGSFVVTPSAAFNSYTAYVSGVNSQSAQITHTTQVYVVVYPQPSVAPTTTQVSCTSSVNAINLHLSFNVSPMPSYTVSWQPIPNGISGPAQTTATGGILPGIYNATVTAQNGCSATASFSIINSPGPTVFSISPGGGNYLINCSQSTVNLQFQPAAYQYTCTHATSPPKTGNNIGFSGPLSIGVWTCTAVNPLTGCASTQTFSIAESTAVPTSSLMPAVQSINCSSLSVTTITASAGNAANYRHQWMGPAGGTLTAAGPTSTFMPGGPGIYTHCVLDSLSGCKTCESFTVNSQLGFPTFSLSSLQNFTLGCNSHSLTDISILNAQTTPTGGALSYTILGPAASPVLPPGPLGSISVYTVNVPGTWTIVVRDFANQCDTRVYATVIQNTFAPSINVSVPFNILTCDQPTVNILGSSASQDVTYNWSFPGTPGNLAGNGITVSINLLKPTSTVVAVYTLTVRDNNNTCTSFTQVPVLQNIFSPKPVVTGASGISCNTPTVMLSNQAVTTVPPYFNPSKPVVGYLWEGPSPEIPKQLSSSYIGSTPGIYTLTVKDMNNGCLAFVTATLSDQRIYPVVNLPDPPPPFVIDCGKESAQLYAYEPAPLSRYTYSWDPVVTATVSGSATRTLTTNRAGLYIVNVTDPANGCTSTGFIEVVNGTLTAMVEADQVSGYAPLQVNLINKSATTNNNPDLISHWKFGNGLDSVTLKLAPVSMLYQQPGTYTVNLWASAGVCIDSASVVIKVEIPSSLQVPDVFSPNGDGVNDLFFVKLSGLRSMLFRVFDRWGNLVYELDNAAGVEWNGKSQSGAEASEGVYFYTVTAKGNDDKEFNLKGTITLVR